MAVTNNLVFKHHKLTRFLVFTFWGFIGQINVTLFPMNFSSSPFSGYTSNRMKIIKIVMGTEKA